MTSTSRSAFLGLVFAACAGRANIEPTETPRETPSSQPPSPATRPTRATPPVAAPPRGLVHSAVHGAQYWAVFVYVGAPGAGVDAALAMLDARGLERGADYSDGELGCSLGAPEALQTAPEQIAVSLYFDEQSNADAFAATIANARVIPVRAACLD